MSCCGRGGTLLSLKRTTAPSLRGDQVTLQPKFDACLSGNYRTFAAGRTLVEIFPRGLSALAIRLGREAFSGARHGEG